MFAAIVPPKWNFSSALLWSLSAVVGFGGLHMASASGLLRRGYDGIDIRTMSCTIAFHQSAMVGTTLYIDGGYIWYNNGSNHVGPNMWLRVLDLSKKFTVNVVDQIPIQFLDRPADADEVSGGDLWAYNGALYQRAGYNEWADKNFPGWNPFPNGSVFDFWKYDIKTNKWGVFQHNPNTTSNAPMLRIRHGQSIVIEGLDKAFIISGEVDSDGSMVDGMFVYDFKAQTWEHQTTRWSAWSMGVVNQVALNETSSGYIVGIAGHSREAGRMDLIEVYDLQYNYWRNAQPATAADERNGIPRPRVKPCSVIARAKDGSSYNIYLFGGWSLDGSTGYNDVWVLSIPSFKWFLVSSGLSPTAGTPPKFEAMTCYIAGGGSKMLVYGGRSRVNNYQAECDRTSVHVFDMTTLMWEEVYDPNSGEYVVPKEISDVIGGGPYGGATLLPKGGMANSDMEAKFKDIIANIQNSTTGNSGSNNSRPNDGASDSGKSEPESGISGGTIAGIVVGAVVGIALILGGIVWHRIRSKPKAEGTNGNPPVEMPTALPPRELHPYGFSPYAQELHGYMPNEIASPSDEGTTGVSYYAPVKAGPNGSVNEADLQGGEGVQQLMNHGHGGEGFQQPLYGDGRGRMQ